MRKTESTGLANRLTAVVLLSVFLVTSAGGWVLRQQLHATLERSFETQLKDRTERLLLHFHTLGIPAAQSDRQGQGDFGRIFSGWYWVLVQQEQVLHSRSNWDSPLDATKATDLHGDQRLWLLQDATGRTLLGMRQQVSLDGRSASLHVFGPADELHAEWSRINRVLLIMQLVTLLGLSLFVTVAVRWGLTPLRRLQHQLRQVHLGQRTGVGSGFGADLEPLASTLDDVLNRNAEVVARAQHQAADLSHSLKKPLALITLEARKETVSGDWLRHQVLALSETIDRHMARLGSGAGGKERVAFHTELQSLLNLMRRLHAERRLRWVYGSSTTDESIGQNASTWRGNTADFKEMVGNLLDNAGKWASEQVRVTCLRVKRTNCEFPLILLRVEDDGPGLSAAQIASAALRGQRFDEATPGHGLGLAIVRDIAESHGGQLELCPSPLGGLRCDLWLPAH